MKVSFNTIGFNNLAIYNIDLVVEGIILLASVSLPTSTGLVFKNERVSSNDYFEKLIKYFKLISQFKSKIFRDRTNC